MKDYSEFKNLPGSQWILSIQEAITVELPDALRKSKQLRALAWYLYPGLDRLSPQEQLAVHDNFVSAYDATGHKIFENEDLNTLIREWKGKSTELCIVTSSEVVEISEVIKQDIAAASMIKEVARSGTLMLAIYGLLEVVKTYPKVFTQTTPRWGMDIKPKTMEALFHLLMGEDWRYDFWRAVLSVVFVEKQSFPDFWKEFHKKIARKPNMQKVADKIYKDYLQLESVQ